MGRRLVEAAHDWAVRAGLREMRMHVFGGDHAARSFYQSLGYSPGATQMHRSLPLADPVLRIVLARGSEGTGMEDLLEPAARRIAGLVPGPAPIESLDYPATATITSFDWPGWVRLGSSPREGIRALVTLLEDHAAHSPTVPVVLMGFSQGALVITEALTPPRRRHHGFAAPALSDRALGVVRAAVSVGNPSFRAGEPFNRGTPAPGVNGMRARTPGLLDHVADRVFDFAEHDDVSAQHLRTSTVEGHLAYGARGYVERIVEAVEPLLRTSAPERP
ncbi:cutinase family protein [Pedococcus ginsenosidimutans]